MRSGSRRRRSTRPPATPATLYVNLVGSAKPLLAERVKGAPQVTTGTTTGLAVARFAPG